MGLSQGVPTAVLGSKGLRAVHLLLVQPPTFALGLALLICGSVFCDARWLLPKMKASILEGSDPPKKDNPILGLRHGVSQKTALKLILAFNEPPYHSFLLPASKTEHICGLYKCKRRKWIVPYQINGGNLRVSRIQKEISCVLPVCML